MGSNKICKTNFFNRSYGFLGLFFYYFVFTHILQHQLETGVKVLKPHTCSEPIQILTEILGA